jgi:ribosomal protein L40E
MSEKPVCRRCGYVGPADARFCAHCGRSLFPLKVRLTGNVNRILDNLSPWHIGFLGLVLLVLISAFAERLIVIELSFPLSLVPLALVIGGGCAILGWDWHASLPDRRYFVRMLLVFVCIAGCLVAIWLVDMGLLSSVTNRASMVVYDIPGVYRQSMAEYRHMSIDISDLTYGLVVMLYGILAAVAGYLIHRERKAHR